MRKLLAAAAIFICATIGSASAANILGPARWTEECLDVIYSAFEKNLNAATNDPEFAHWALEDMKFDVLTYENLIEMGGNEERLQQVAKALTDAYTTARNDATCKVGGQDTFAIIRQWERDMQWAWRYNNKLK
jgi:hypothetical protein